MASIIFLNIILELPKTCVVCHGGNESTKRKTWNRNRQNWKDQRFLLVLLLVHYKNLWFLYKWFLGPSKNRWKWATFQNISEKKTRGLYPVHCCFVFIVSSPKYPVHPSHLCDSFSSFSSSLLLTRHRLITPITDWLLSSPIHSSSLIAPFIDPLLIKSHGLLFKGNNLSTSIDLSSPWIHRVPNACHMQFHLHLDLHEWISLS
jgi:hypothetical protein